MSPKLSLPYLFLVLSILIAGPVQAQLTYEGSSSIGEGLLPELAKAFTAKTGTPFGQINPTNSAQGFQAVKDGKARLGGLSRLLNKEELEAGLANRVIGYDALVIFVHASNPIASMTVEQIRSVFSGKTTTWKDLGWDDIPIVTLVKLGGEEGGVVGQFREVVMEGASLASPSLAFPSHLENIQYVASNPAAITFAALAGDSNLARIMPIEGIGPSPRTLNLGQYPLGRPYLLVFRDTPTDPDVAKFLEFVFSPEGQEIVKRFVVPVMTFEQ